ncbi:lipid-A-disaccharide synthase N-terminal domain-containing protein [Tautonia rosea]|uniref:lipid-A-disaccharide synthase N-terminal domain-containing protein n=1 Tax=Tautonia rosea TaxID=2728037 RepID=UPI001473F075|nr:lipid-A-disaccharide synthase N-terminal domain-containing protein [Tautonia rosea]
MSWFGGYSSTEAIWLGVGFAGQLAFTSRFLVQWVASERRRDSVVPIAFWWFSLAGGLTLLSYAIHKRDPVIVVGQAVGVLIYTRNLFLISQARRDRGRDSSSALATEANRSADLRPHPADPPPVPNATRIESSVSVDRAA